MILLKATKIKKSFDGEEVLEGIDLSVSQGEVISIIGPSGSGKSTLLRCLTQLESADSGEIIICDEKIMWMENGKAKFADTKTMHSAILNVGLVFQNFQLFPHWNVLKNIADALISVLGKSKEEAEKTARDLLKKMDLSQKENSYPCELSGGQQQRVAIARALALSPKILFFDEPTSALDPELTGEILKVIRKLAKQNMTMVIVTHEMGFAKDISDKVIFMDGGMVLAEGSPKDILENPSSERIKAFLNLVKHE